MNTTPMTQERLDTIQGRVNAASSGPWVEGTRCVFTEDYARAVVSDSLVEAPGRTPYGEAVQNPADVALIAHAPEDLTDLLAEVERLKHFESIVSWRYGDTTDGRTREDMVERAARAFYEYPTPGIADNLRTNWDRLTKASPDVADNHRAHMRAVLDAALNPREGS